MASISSIRIIACVLTATVLPPVVFAQGTDTSAYIRQLVPEIRDLQVTVTELEGQQSDLAGDVQKLGEDSENITVRETEDAVVIAIASDVLFDFDSAALSSEAKQTLVKVADLLNQNQTPDDAVRVVGHTDSKGSDDYNQALSEKRASAVVEFLTSNGIESASLKAEGHGETEI